VPESGLRLKTFRRSVWVSARNELADAVRSRRVAVILILYLGGAMLACNGFVSALRKLENQLSETLALPKAASTGAVADALWRSEFFRQMITNLVGEREVAMQLLSIPPFALIYAWLVLTFTPGLVMLAGAARISTEVDSGSVRFVLTRIPRAAWCLGKFFGQCFQVLLAIALSTIGAWCVARFRLAGISQTDLIPAMILYGGKAWVYSVAFVGVALGISQTVRSPNLAMALGFLAWIVLAALHVAASHYCGPGWRQLWYPVGLINPMGHLQDLWRLDAAHVVPAIVFLVALSQAYLFAGFAAFGRRDL
jgi:ABC-type transport system involved in multi-copper enzyme maturation permease subunit